MRSGVWVAMIMLGGALNASEHRTCHDAKIESGEPAAQLYAVSPFVHGYRDGYQQGFHDADLDQQFAHQPSNSQTMRDYRDVHYKSEFGKRDSYVTGFRAGFLRGIGDMQSGLEFRLFSILDMAKKTEDPRVAVSQPVSFDKGIKQGYASRHRSTPNTQDGSKQSDTVKVCSAASATSFCAGVRFGEELASAEQLQTAQK